jgi:hypothetical protein
MFLYFGFVVVANWSLKGQRMPPIVDAACCVILILFAVLISAIQVRRTK